jgi:hypothetical protein
MGEQTAQDGEKPRSGLSAAAWATIGTLGAALLTTVVTLVTLYLPPARPDPAAVARPAAPTGSAAGSSGRSAGSAVPTAPAAASSSAQPIPRSSLPEELAGRWQGKVSAGGQAYTMTLDISGTCRVGAACGSMTTDLYGCVGDLVLVRVNDGPQFDVATVDLREGSSPSCELRPGGGDYFTLGKDVLVYVAGYDGSRSGTLRRVQ